MPQSSAPTTTHSIFLVSVAVGAIGLAISETYLDRSLGGIGFWAGFLLAYSGLAAISLHESPSESSKVGLDALERTAVTTSARHSVNQQAVTTAPSVNTK